MKNLARLSLGTTTLLVASADFISDLPRDQFSDVRNFSDLKQHGFCFEPELGVTQAMLSMFPYMYCTTEQLSVLEFDKARFGK